MNNHFIHQIEDYQHINFETVSRVLDDTLLHFFFSPSVDRFY